MSYEQTPICNYLTKLQISIKYLILQFFLDYYGVAFLELARKRKSQKRKSQVHNVVSDVWADKDCIGRLSVNVFRIMYFGKRHENLTTFR